MFKIINNPDSKLYDELTIKIHHNMGYCLCAGIKNKDTQCICKEFREQRIPGPCNCGRFVKVEV